MLIALKGFGGRAPRVDPTLLPPTAAQVATGTKMWRGTLGPFRDHVSVVTPSRPGVLKSIYRFGRTAPESQYWFHWNDDVNCVRGPVAGDTAERTYFTGDGVPKVTDVALALTGGGTIYPINSRPLGVPQPSNAIFAQPPGVPAGGSDTPESRVYLYTYVSSNGEEGKPSPASNMVQAKVGDTIALVGMSGAPSGGYDIVSKRIYRAAVGNSSSGYQFVAEIPVGTTSYNDSKLTTELGETLSSTYYDAPDAAMIGLIALPNACMAGFVKNEVCFSEPGLPHAWPKKYRLTAEHDIVALGHFGNTVVVLTEGNPYLTDGIDPASMSMRMMEIQQACVSKRSVVSVGEMVLYASPDGLVSVGPNGVELVTKELFTRDDWQAFVPSSIHAYFHEGRYIAFYDTGTVLRGFVIDIGNRQFYDLGFYATAGFNDLRNDALYLLVNGQIRRWDASDTTLLAYTWRSKKFVLPRETNFAAALVRANSYANLTAKFYADGVLKHTQTVTNGLPFRLPAGFLAKQWEIELTGTDEVAEVMMANSIAELKSQ